MCVLNARCCALVPVVRSRRAAEQNGQPPTLIVAGIVVMIVFAVVGEFFRRDVVDRIG